MMIAEPNEAHTWNEFVRKLEEYYKPTENLPLKKIQFRSLSQEKDEAFTAFCNKVKRDAKHCKFKCESDNCTAESTAVRAQIIFGMSSDKIRKEALRKAWDLSRLKKEGISLESASKGTSEISGDYRINVLANIH